MKSKSAQGRYSEEIKDNGEAGMKPILSFGESPGRSDQSSHESNDQNNGSFMNVRKRSVFNNQNNSVVDILNFSGVN